jgi:2-polyprenyl-3-methyl-5-hydroxy-6-metoxy-1,4-benzoquinol methylase
VQSEGVKTFFNRIAHEYLNKYSIQNPFHRWYFLDRLSVATSGMDFNGKIILDIGTGTGALYDFLLASGFNEMQFIGCDIAEKMMEQSHIPKSNCYTGNCYDIHFKNDTFDFIFMLGVSTYIDAQEQDKIFEFIHHHLGKNGIAVVSFTNKSAINYILYTILRPFTRMFGLKKRVAGQSFQTYGYSSKHIRALLENKFMIKNILHINQTFFPFNHLFPETSIKIAQYIRRNVRNKLLLNIASSEFLVKLRKK